MSADPSPKVKGVAADKVKAVVESLPSYKDGVFDSADVGIMLAGFGVPNTPQQVARKIKYLNIIFGGKMTLEQILSYMEVYHDANALMQAQMKTIDLDGDGFISMDEYELSLGCLAHLPEFEELEKNLTYAKFVELADANKDGKVSLEEARDFFTKQLEYGRKG